MNKNIQNLKTGQVIACQSLPGKNCVTVIHMCGKIYVCCSLYFEFGT